MTTIQSRASFTFPERDNIDSVYASSSSGVSSRASSISNLDTTPSIITVSIQKPPIQADLDSKGQPQQSSQLHQQTPALHPLRISNPPQCLTITPLIQSDIALSAARNSAISSAHSTIQLIIYHNIVYRLHGSLSSFHSHVSDKSRAEPSKFANSYQQAIDLCTSILNNHSHNNTYSNTSTHFLNSLKTGHRSLLNSFLTLIKSSPSFISSALISQTPQDLNNFVSPSIEPIDDLTRMNRSNPMDILFYALFPLESAEIQRAEYFSSICASLIDNKKGENFCFAILDKIMTQSGYPFSWALENLLLSILQDGSFMTLPAQSTSSSASNNASTTNFRHRSSSSVSSAPSSGVPSPELAHASLATSLGAKSLMATKSTSSLSSVDEASEERISQFLTDSAYKLFEFFDDQAMEAIPGNFLVFCQMVLKKVLSRHHRIALLMIVVKYFFQRHLYKILVRPEDIGILKCCFINDLQRKKILIPVFQKMYKLVASCCYDWHQPDQVDPSIRAHVDSILARFCEPAPDSIPSPFGLETDHLGSNSKIEAEFYSPGQFIALAPSDIVCLYSGLFPTFVSNQKNALFKHVTSLPPAPTNNNNNNARPMSVIERKSSGSGLRSYGISSGILNLSSSFLPETTTTTATSFITTQNLASNESLPSLHESNSVVFDNADEELFGTDLEDEDDDQNTKSAVEDYEWSLEDIRGDLEPVVEELIKKFPYLQFKVSSNQYLHSLRPAKLQSFRLPHPMNEKWQLFKVRDDGVIIEVDADSMLEHARLSKGTAMLKSDTANATDEISPIAHSNRGLALTVKRAVEKLVSDIANAPYDQSARQQDDQLHASSSPTYLLTLLTEAFEKNMAKGNFIEASEYSNAVGSLNKLLPSLSSATYTQVAISVNNYIIQMISKEKEQNTAKVNYQIEVCQSYDIPYKTYLNNAKVRCEISLDMLNNLRTKIWYITEIRSSRLWNRAKLVTKSLSLGGSAQNDSSTSPQDSNSNSTNALSGLKRNHSSGSLSSSGVFSFKRFTSVSSKRDYANRRHSVMNTIIPPSEGMFAPKELAGQFKLSDREADATKKWLIGQHIQNYCTGEERIHRFCCEVDDLVKRIMGDALSNRKNKGHSLLSSSSLFKNDLWRMIVEVEGIERASTPSLGNNSYSQGIHANKSLSMSETLDADFMKINIDKSQSMRIHRSQNSSPNLLDMFSSMDMGSSRRSSPHDSGFESGNSELWSHGKLNISPESSIHRRNKSLNDSKFGENDYFGNPPVSSASLADDQNAVNNNDYASSNTSEIELKRQKLDEYILDIQMTLTGLIYTDIGRSCWFEGSETDQWIQSPIVRAAITRDAEMKMNLRSVISKNMQTQISMFKLGDLPSEATSRRASRRYSGTSQRQGTFNPAAESNETLNIGKVNTQPSRESLNTAAGPTGSTVTQSTINTNATTITNTFNFDEAYKKILERLSVTPSPLEKLNIIYALETLVVSALSTNGVQGVSTPGSIRSFSRSNNMASISSEFPSADRTPIAVEKAGGWKTSNPPAMSLVGEAIATVEAKRSSSGLQAGPMLLQNSFGRNASGPNTDAIAEELRRIFKANELSSKTLFRDLQFIAAFVPQNVLDMTDLGKAFWDVSLAALSLKEETLGIVVDTAAQIFQYYSDMITSNEMDDNFLSQWSLSDCAWLWSISSKEGDVVGQRELAIMHMSHPQIAPICLLPFSKLSEMFDSSLLDDPKIIGGDLDKLDPIRMAIIKHWMSNAAEKGDNIAAEYLMQQNPSAYI